MSTANPPYNARFLMPSDLSAVKSSVLAVCEQLITPLLESAAAGTLTVREAEEECWKVLLPLGAALFTALLGALCRAASERCASERRWSLEDGDARYRLDDDYTAHLSSTFGPVAVPLFAMRTPGPGSATVTPARKLFPHYPQMRSSELLVEWECALAADHPSRKAAEALLFFSHGAADIEDTTIERHAVAVGKAVPWSWLYRTPAAIRKVLRERAVRDLDTGLPIIYASTDAHALKRFVDDKWNPKWKMTNGIRLWAIDEKSGETIHLGGQYTWGDCMEVRRCFERLQDEGILPADGDYGEGVVAQVALVTDGLDWIADYVLPLYPEAVTALDPYHVLQHVAEAAKKAFPGKKNEKKVKALVAKARRALGMRKKRERLTLRKGEPRKERRARRSGYDGSGERLLDEVLRPLLDAATRGKARIRQAIAYVERNLFRLDYGELRTRGFQVGSGAMESLHRTGSQVRLKRAGCHWTAEAAQAILNLRMLGLSSRWNEYWSQTVLPHLSPTGGVS
jgi:hypothetical protein